MHELSIACAIIEAVAEVAQGRKVSRVTIEVGKLSGVMAGAMAFCFAEAARGTEAEGACLEIEEIEAWAQCEACNEQFAMPSLLAACRCGSRNFRLLTGGELILKSIELEEAV